MTSRTSFIFLAVGLAVLLLSMAIHRQHKRDHYATGPADVALPALTKAHGYALRSLDVAPNVRLQGILRVPRSDQARFVLFFPGNSEQQLAASLPALEAVRAGRDVGFVAFASRGFDGSTGIPSPAALESDARAQLAYVRGTLHVEAERLVVMGYSLGSGIALRLAAELSRAQQPPAAVVLLSPYWTIAFGPASPFELLLPSEHYRVADIVADVKSPVLVVAGERDEALPVATHAHPLVRALPSGRQYWELPGRNHVDYLQDSALLARIGNFALTVMPRPRPTTSAHTQSVAP
jgi:pimeloyl-ACP methyl ester carboxylesterase